MAVTIRIPEGFVLVPRAAGVAAALLEAADRLHVDRKTTVRTTASGYHARLDVAEEYRKALPEAVVIASSEELGDAEAEAPAVEAQAPASEAVAIPVTADSTHAEIDAYAASLEPAVDVSSGKNRAEKIALLEAAINHKSAENGDTE